jgi:hypothetical protein
MGHRTGPTATVMVPDVAVSDGRECHEAAVKLPPEEVKSFTAKKLDWLSALSVDPRVPSYAFHVGFCIVQHANARTGIAMVADGTVGDKTGLSRRHVQRARDLLRAIGWIDWKRTRTASLYHFKTDNLNSALDLLTMRRDNRQERWTERVEMRRRGRNTPGLDAPPRAQQDAPRETQQDAPPRAHIHLQCLHTHVSTLKGSRTPKGVIVERGPILSRSEC